MRMRRLSIGITAHRMRSLYADALAAITKGNMGGALLLCLYLAESGGSAAAKGQRDGMNSPDPFSKAPLSVIMQAEETTEGRDMR